MASVFLDSGDTFTISNNNVRVFGSTGTEVVNVASGVTGETFDQNVERVSFGVATSTLSFQQQGINLLVFSGTTLLGTIILQADADGTLITTTDGTMQAKVSATGMTLGGTAVPSAAAAAVVPGTVDTTVKATGNGAGPVVGQAFALTNSATADVLTLTAGNDTVTGGAGTLATGDMILDASTSDNDTATLTVSANATPTITNVENITLNYALGAALTVTASSISGEKQITVGSFEAGATAAAIDGLKTGKTIVVDNAIKSLSLTTNSATDNNEAATVRLQGNSITLTTNAANDIDQLTINSTGASNTVTLATVADVFSATGESITVTGDKNLTIKSADTGTTGLNGATVTKSLTAGTLTVELTGALNAATQDLSKVAADQFVLSTATTTAASTVTVASGSSIKVSADFGAGHATNMALASKTADGTLTLNATANQTNRVNVNSTALLNVNVTDTVTIADLTLGNAAGLTGAKVAVAGTDSAKTLTLTTVAAKEVDATGLAGKLIVNGNTIANAKLTGGANNDQINNGNVAGVTVDGGAGDDTITIGGANGGTFKGGEGNDTFNISAAANLVGTFDGGNGTDSLVFTLGGGAGNRDVSGNNFTLTGIELIDLGAGADAGHTVTFKGAQLTGQSLNIVDTNGSAAAVAVNVAVAGTAENIDLSNINTNLAITITGSNLADIIKGTKGADVIVGGTGADTLTGGTGDDKFVFAAGSTDKNITDFVSGDKLLVGSAASNTAGAFVNSLATVTSAQQATIDAAANLTDAVAAVSTALGGIAVNKAVLFNYKTAQYIFMNEDTANQYDAGTDAIVKIVGATATTVFADANFLFAA